MDNVVGTLIGVMVCVIILYNVALPTINTSINTSGAGTANLSTQNYNLSLVIPTLLITTIVVYVVRSMLA